MFKKFAIAVPMTLLTLSSSLAFAEYDASTTINITATIPTQVFHAQPVNPDFGKDEKMAYNLVAGTLDPLRATYDIRHTNGSVSSPAASAHAPRARAVGITTPRSPTARTCRITCCKVSRPRFSTARY